MLSFRFELYFHIMSHNQADMSVRLHAIDKLNTFLLIGKNIFPNDASNNSPQKLYDNGHYQHQLRSTPRQKHRDEQDTQYRSHLSDGSSQSGTLLTMH